jgi:hypothetical protein
MREVEFVDMYIVKILLKLEKELNLLKQFHMKIGILIFVKLWVENILLIIL